MRTVGYGRTGFGALLTKLAVLPFRLLARLASWVLARVPRRARRIAEKIESMPAFSTGHFTAIAFVACFVLYGLIAGGHVFRFAESALTKAGLRISQIAITGQVETPELAILEELRVHDDQSLLTYSAHEAQSRVLGLPWVAKASIRKLYPNKLEVKIEEKVPIALWQLNNDIALIDQAGDIIEPYTDPRFVGLPLVVGRGANAGAAEFIAQLGIQTSIMAKTKASVFVADRRWNLVMENGIVVKLPENDLTGALDQLAILDSVDGLLSRDIVIVDLRLADRITVRLPDDTAEFRKTRSAAEIDRLRKAGART